MRRACPTIYLFLLFASISLPAPTRALKPTPDYPARPSDFGMVYREIDFQTADSLVLRGWFYPAQDTAYIANDLIGRMLSVPPDLKRPPRSYPEIVPSGTPTIVLCDGDGGNMGFSIFYAYQYCTRGFHVFTFDWRGFGESDPWPLLQNELCRPEFLKDYAAAIDIVKTQPEVDPTKIGLLGFSTGAYLSFATASSRSDVGALVGRALLTSFDDLLEILGRLDPERGFVAPPNYPEELLPIHAAPHMCLPVFLVVGEKDERTPPWMSEEVSEKLPGPKELWVVPGATHGGPAGPELIDYPQFFERTAAFYWKHLVD